MGMAPTDEGESGRVGPACKPPSSRYGFGLDGEAPVVCGAIDQVVCLILIKK